MTCVYFVRHAKPDFSVHDDRIRPLSEQGESDAEQVAEFLRDKSISYIISSPYKRSIDTVKPLADMLELEINTDYDFRERCAGKWHGDRFFEFVAQQWADFDYKAENGESLRCVQKRNISALERVISDHPNENVVVATHGTALSTIINFYQPWGYEDFLRIADYMPYVIKMEFEDDRFVGMSEELIIERRFEG